MVGSCDVVVAVGFNAFDCVVCVETKLFENLLINNVVQRHEFLSRKKTFRGFVFELPEPGVLSDFLDVIAMLRVHLENFADEV